MSQLVSVGFHEFDADWLFEYDTDNGEDSGLKPFYGMVRRFREADADLSGTVEIDGTEWEGRLIEEESGIGALNHPSCDFDVIHEYRLHFRRVEDSVGKASGAFHIRPRAPEMETEDGDSINSPPFTGVAVRAQGSNLPFHQYLPIFRGLMRSFGISRRYWRDKHLHQDSYTNIRDGEAYVRIDNDAAGQLIAVDGVIARIANLLAGDREGYTKHVRDDRDRPGDYHTATIGDKRASELVEFHQFAKEIKLYYAREDQSFDDDHPLAHPKLGVSYQQSKSDSTIYWSDLERFHRELEELLLNVLQWAGLPITGDVLDEGSPYIESDPYFDPEPSHRQRRLVDDPTPKIRQQQKDLVIEHLVKGVEDSDMDVLQYMVEDGGQVEPLELADETGWHYQTIYRAIDRLEDMVEHNYADLQLRSHYVAQEVAKTVQEAKRAGQDAMQTMAEALELETDMEIAHDALTHWVDQYGVEVDDRAEASMLLRFGEAFDDRDELRTALTEGLFNWRKAGWMPEKFRQAEVKADYKGRRQLLNVNSILRA